MRPITTRRRLVLARAEADRRFQFGQPGAGTYLIPANNACGANAVQKVHHIWTGQRVTMNAVIRAAAWPGPPADFSARGMLTSEVLRALAVLLRVQRAGYTGTTSATASDVVQLARHRGPVIVLYRYGTTPEWEGYRYRGQQADGVDSVTGRVVGYAREPGRAGRNQLSGFDDGAHYVVVLSSKWRRRTGGEDVWLHDSNHASSARPERPRWDVVSAEQFERMYRSGADVTFSGDPWAAVPSRAL